MINAPTDKPISKKRKYFGTDGIRGRVGDHPITAEFVLKLGWAVGKVLARQGYGKVLIGKDTRISGYMFESVLEAGLSSAGVDVHLLGPMPTPAIAYLTRTLRASAGIVISASHNPYFDNGIKFFSDQGSKLPDDIEHEIENQLDQPMTIVNSAELGKAIRIVDAPGRYIEFCKSSVSPSISFKGLEIVVDCANGAAYSIAPKIFRELGAVVYEVGTEPNGLNINLDCGATHPETLRQVVLSRHADLGIALDGDGDRLMMVDKNGDILDGDEILYIIAKHLKSQGQLKGGVVGTVMTNLGLEQSLTTLGIDLVRVPVGDRYIINELQVRGWSLGGEPSGHIICRNATTTGDGIISALQILSAMQMLDKSLTELRQNFHRYPNVLLNVRISQSVNFHDNDELKTALELVKNELGAEGRVLVRKSGTEPVVRIMVEGKDADAVHRLANYLADVVKTNLSD